MITVYRSVDLNRLCQTEPLTGMLFTCEAGGHQFIITGQRNREDVQFSGSVSGRFIPPGNGDAILFTPGTYAEIDSDGRAVITLPDNCYSVTGQFGLIITNTEDGHTSVIYSAVGTVVSGDTSEIVDPTSTINVDAIVALMGQMQTALLNCQGAASYIADEYDTTGATTYLEDDYAIYEGALYRCIDDGVSSTFDPTVWTEVNVTDELSQNVTRLEGLISGAVSNLSETCEIQLRQLASVYSSTSTYAVGDYCTYNNKFYKCTTAITSGEAWTSSHWSDITVADELQTLTNAVSSLVVASSAETLTYLGIT